MNDEELRRQWLSWVEKNIGGSTSRIDAAMRAVAAAVDQRKTTDSIASSARRAADDWDRAGVSRRPADEPLSEASYGGIYDVVAADKSDLGRATLAALNSVTMHKVLRTKAFIATRGFRGRYGFGGPGFSYSILLIILFVASVIGGLSLRLGFYPAIAVLFLVILRVTFVLFVSGILAHRAKIDISHGRLMITYGLFSTAQLVVELHWIREVGLKQSFVQKLFNEATIWINVDTPSRGLATLSIPGLVPVSDMQDCVNKLRNVAQKLRQGNYYAKSFIG